ncbi:hypothetical protein, partial [Mesorhizobium sp. Root102]|uniref:hypothetical protein n=1 Tax=Mesorhizobium sp. Root102 TaxID=1736422 RepID=UPI001AECB4BA
IPAEKTQGKGQTWVNSRWKYPGLPGQFSVAINNRRFAGDLLADEGGTGGRGACLLSDWVHDYLQ